MTIMVTDHIINGHVLIAYLKLVHYFLIFIKCGHLTLHNRTNALAGRRGMCPPPPPAANIYMYMYNVHVDLDPITCTCTYLFSFMH